MAQSTVGRILRGEVDPQVSNLERIAAALKMPFVKLLEVSQAGMPLAAPTDEVPLISWGQLGALADASDRTPLDWMPRPKHSGPRTFALRVRGESMEPIYQHGDIIFVDRDVIPQHGSDVLALLGEHDDEAVFKRLVLEGEGERQYLKPLNPTWPTRIIDVSAYPAAQIVGVVIGKWVAIGRAS